MRVNNDLVEAGVMQTMEVAMLSQVYDELSASPYYLGNRPARHALAGKLLQAFRSGVTDPEELKKACVRS